MVIGWAKPEYREQRGKAVSVSTCKKVRKGGKPRSRHAGRRSRCLGLEALEQRQMLDATGDAFVVPLGEGESSPLPDFSLIDKNSTSPTYQDPVSPRDYLGHVSGWYLGASL
jgi:hypothetical protein